jgi:hypothetical protein
MMNYYAIAVHLHHLFYVLLVVKFALRVQLRQKRHTSLDPVLLVVFRRDGASDKHDEVGRVPGGAQGSLTETRSVHGAHEHMCCASAITGVILRYTLHHRHISLKLRLQVYMWHGHEKLPGFRLGDTVGLYVPARSLQE